MQAPISAHMKKVSYRFSYFDLNFGFRPDFQLSSRNDWSENQILKLGRNYRVSATCIIQLASGMITQGSLCANYYRIGRVHKYFVHRLVALVFCPKEKGN